MSACSRTWLKFNENCSQTVNLLVARHSGGNSSRELHARVTSHVFKREHKYYILSGCIHASLNSLAFEQGFSGSIKNSWLIMAAFQLTHSSMAATWLTSLVPVSMWKADDRGKSHVWHGAFGKMSMCPHKLDIPSAELLLLFLFGDLNCCRIVTAIQHATARCVDFFVGNGRCLGQSSNNDKDE